jgi:hypothetical protein
MCLFRNRFGFNALPDSFVPKFYGLNASEALAEFLACSSVKVCGEYLHWGGHRVADFNQCIVFSPDGCRRCGAGDVWLLRVYPR